MSPALRAAVVLIATLVGVAAGAGRHGLAAAIASTQERESGLTIDFIAVDADGNPVPDLQAAEVEVRIADRVRALRSIRRVVTASGAGPATATAVLPPPYGTNDNVSAGRRIVLVVDQESFVAGREPLLRNAVSGLAGHLTPADQTMIAALPFGGIVLPFTSSQTMVRAAIDRVAGQGSRTESGSDLACRTRRFLESFEGLLRQMSARAAPTTVVVFTAGMAAPRRDAPMGLLPGMCELLVDQFRHVGAAAGAARATVYISQPADVGLNRVQRPTAGGVGDIGSDNPLEGIEHLAGATGATRLSLDATGTESLRLVATETSSYYVAEIEPVRGEPLGRSRSLDIRIARRGVVVRARPEVRFVEPSPAASKRLALTDVLASPEAFTDVPLRTGGFSVRDAEGQLRVGILVEPAGATASLSSVGAILIDEGGRVAGRWLARDASERPLLGAIVATPGTYRLRVAAVDSEGRVGAAEDTIDARLVQVGPIALGSVMLGVSRTGTNVLQLEFGSEPTALATFDIYGGDAGMKLGAAVEVARSLDGPALATLPVALSRADTTRVVATGVVPLGALTPGDYVVRGTVRLEDGTTGRVTRTLRKVR